MAKSSSFFGLRRGSTKSLTFQVNYGKQITKDRVSVVKNPRSDRQQWQRAIMATVMNAYSYMKPICDHAFEGKIVSQGNMREFMRLNLDKIRNLLAADMINEIVDETSKVRLTAPKVPALVPNNYVVSRGSMEKNKVFNIEALSHGGSEHFYLVLPDISALLGYPGAGIPLTHQVVWDYLGLSADTQVTFCFGSISDNNPLYSISGYETAGSVYPSVFTYCRWKFANYAPNDEFTLTGSTDAEKLTSLWVSIFNTFRTLDTPQDIVNGLIESSDYMTIDGKTCILAEGVFSNYGVDESLTWGCAVITSEIDGAGRSNAEMVILPESDFGLAPGAAIDAWTHITAKIGESDRYLEGGK